MRLSFVVLPTRYSSRNACVCETEAVVPSEFVNVAVAAVGGRMFLGMPKALGVLKLTPNLAKAVTCAMIFTIPFSYNRIRRYWNIARRVFNGWND